MTKIKRITPEKAEKIIKTRKPRGLFLCKDNGVFLAIDNITGNAWCEEFVRYSDSINYLNHREKCFLNKKKIRKIKQKRMVLKKIELIISYLSAVLVILGVSLMVALLIFAPVIQKEMYYLLLMCGIGGVGIGLFIYLFIFGELKGLTNDDQKNNIEKRDF